MTLELAKRTRGENENTYPNRSIENDAGDGDSPRMMPTARSPPF